MKAMLLNLYKSLRGLDKRERILDHRSLFSKRALPNLFILGTQKGGTSSLYKYLVSHPAILESYQKEAQFFNRSFKHGTSYYRAFFPKQKDIEQVKEIHGKAYAIDASPDYLDFPGVPEKLSSLSVDSKFIVLLREPSERAYSHYKMTQRLTGKFEPLNFHEALNSEDQRLSDILSNPDHSDYDKALKHSLYSYREKGYYARHLSRWFSHFPREKFLILYSEEFFTDPQKTLSKCFDFLGLEQKQIERVSKIYNKGQHNEIDEDLTELRAHFEESILELSDLLGERPPW